LAVPIWPQQPESYTNPTPCLAPATPQQPLGEFSGLVPTSINTSAI
jgi:hypothetical protein